MDAQEDKTQTLSNAETDPSLSEIVIPKDSSESAEWRRVKNVLCVECPNCLFIFAAAHTTGNSDSYYCPSCNDGIPEASDVWDEAIEAVDRAEAGTMASLQFHKGFYAAQRMIKRALEFSRREALASTSAQVTSNTGDSVRSNDRPASKTEIVEDEQQKNQSL